MTYSPPAPQAPAPVFQDDTFYARIMGWLFLAFAAATAGIFLLGPIVPDALRVPLYFVALGALILSAFSRKVAALAPVFTVAIPTILGLMLYPTLNYLQVTGGGNIIGLAAAGTAVVFGMAAVIGWKSQKTLYHWGGKLFFITLGVIAVSLLNAFFFQIEGLGLLISLGVVVIFSIYSFIDIQAVRDRAYGDVPAQYALNIFLNIYNIFVALLNIFSFFRD
jgi:FtsH-binding integral membrane protein